MGYSMMEYMGQHRANAPPEALHNACHWVQDIERPHVDGNLRRGIHQRGDEQPRAEPGTGTMY
jgi:hypothetical protein